eukprot:scaffold14005_cov30-Tisochrysis_lutea.AAC.5
MCRRPARHAAQLPGLCLRHRACGYRQRLPIARRLLRGRGELAQLERVGRVPAAERWVLSHRTDGLSRPSGRVADAEVEEREGSGHSSVSPFSRLQAARTGRERGRAKGRRGRAAAARAGAEGGGWGGERARAAGEGWLTR